MQNVSRCIVAVPQDARDQSSIVKRKRLIILGAAGRDFHDFNVHWKAREDVEVICFTATQIPNIEGRVYPPELSGPRYPDGIPIHPEERLEALIAEHAVSDVALAYSDLAHVQVMHLASRVQAAGANFRLLGPAATMLAGTKPVIAVCAVRTGSGKSQTTRRVSAILGGLRQKVAVVRHPMPYGKLLQQVCQRFATRADLEREQCTIEEREEYEPHLDRGNVVFAGIDYERILRLAEQESDVVLWDGGNNDLPFFRPDLHIVVADPHRTGHETSYYPGETNLRMADLVIVNKVDTADPASVERLALSIREVNGRATVLRADSPIAVDGAERIAGKKVLVVEDGPTLTHGDMAYGAGHVAARRFGAAEILDPRPYARGSIRKVFESYRQVTAVLPAMGYGAAQIAELEATIRAVPCDVVLIATPIDLGSLMKLDKPALRVRYELREHDPAALEAAVRSVLR
jgi:predicted GTPase